ncbi:uncharacterized protein LOC124369131 [Homalodisca vitripennis]|uniref:uncharacterized protein LOC124369131 n=1 Tax=Homalodisca vitripennis TaxID=197043 RepID=UPI001EECE461|nr:uncharacterized protein LOC124369131 [Homalodisca vitripennis]
METLPMMVVKIIAHCLNPMELAACCGTSQTWREIFGNDIFWERYCSSNIAEHLATAVSRVQPKFVSPENEQLENTLSPIGEWRLAFMKEHILWNHWKNGEMIQEMINIQNPYWVPSYEGARCEFVTNDHLITFRRNRVMLWNISNYPQYISDPVLPLSSHVVNFYSQLDENKIIFVQGTIVQIYCYGFPINTKWSLEQYFMFNRTDRTRVNIMKDMETVPSNVGCIVKENFFVGYCDDQLHIWNLSGTKLGTVLCPGLNNYEISGIVTSKTPSKDLLIEVVRNNKNHLYVFNLDKLEFYPSTYNYGDSWRSSYAIANGLLAICHKHSFKIYNYHTITLVWMMPAAYTVGVLFLEDYFIFIATNTMYTFHTITGSSQCIFVDLTDDIENIYRFNDTISDKFVLQTHRWNEILYEVDLKSTPIKFKTTKLQEAGFLFHDDIVINNSCTKAATMLTHNRVKIISKW